MFSVFMNHIDRLSQSESFFVRHVSTRIVMLTAAAPLEACEFLKNLTKLPLQPLGCICKQSIRAVNLFLGSSRLENFQKTRLPTLRVIVRTAIKVVCYAIGVFSTLTFGLISPRFNFCIHVKLGLVIDEEAEEAGKKKLMSEQKLREAQEMALQAQIQTLIFAMKDKVESHSKPGEHASENMGLHPSTHVTKKINVGHTSSRKEPISVENDIVKRIWEKGGTLYRN